MAYVDDVFLTLRRTQPIYEEGFVNPVFCRFVVTDSPLHERVARAAAAWFDRFTQLAGAELGQFVCLMTSVALARRAACCPRGRPLVTVPFNHLFGIASFEASP